MILLVERERDQIVVLSNRKLVQRADAVYTTGRFTWFRVRPIPEAARKSSLNSASLSAILKSHSFVRRFEDEDVLSCNRMFFTRRLFR